MSPQDQSHNGKNHRSSYPTSPWTEAYQAKPAATKQQAATQTTPERPYDAETQAPTHDALSSIYNRGY